MRNWKIRFIAVLLLLLAVFTPVFADDDESGEKDSSFGITTSSVYQEVFSSPDYLVTPGDVYVLSYNAAGTAVKYTVIVDPSYKFRISNLGIIDAKGKTFLELKQEVEDIVSSNYPMSAVQMVLTIPSTFKVTAMGEVGAVTEMRVNGLTRVSSIVYATANGNASTRFVTVTDSEGNSSRYDLFQANRFGDMSQDPYVRPNDVITLEKAERRVSISGSVLRPGTYELLKGENLKRLIDYYAEGFTDLADTENITLSRALTSSQKSTEVIYLSETDYGKDYKLLNHDGVTVGSRTSLMRTVFVEGAIAVDSESAIQEQLQGSSTVNPLANHTAAFAFSEGEDYAHFVRSHRGLFSDSADLYGAYVSRNGSKIGIDLYSMIFDPEYETTLLLQADDILVVPFIQSFVTVTGAVGEPGRYPYIPDRKWDYYVSLAGGYNKSLNSPETLEIVTYDGRKLTTDDYILPETTINAPSNLKVTITGEVTRNQEITIGSSLTRLSDIVGSYMTAYSSGRFVTVRDKDGNVSRYDFFLADRFGDFSQNPYVKDGDCIILERVQRRVSISGSVERPGTYELKDGENLKRLVQYYAGGLDPMADTDNITLVRTLSDVSRSGDVRYLDRSVLTADYDLVNRDSVTIGNKASLKNTIFVQGAVGVQISETTSGEVPTRNIRYNYEEGETYAKFVKSHKDWFTDVSDYERAYVSRNGERISIDLYDMLFDPDYEDDLKMEPDDIMVIPFKQFFVTVSGAVRSPGRYAYVPDRTWEYYVGLAGGFDPDLNSGEKVTMTTNKGETLTKSDYITPETTIDAARNSFLYKFNKFATPLLTILSIITSTIVIYNTFGR